MSAAEFCDTNVLLYLLSSEWRKADEAERVMQSRPVVSVQVLNEFASVATRKARLEPGALNEILSAITSLCTVVAVTLDTHRLGMRLCHRHGFPVSDAMVAAAALEAGCTELLTEDFQAGQQIEGRLRVVNPFAA